MCRVFWDAMIFCNNFARWLQKIVATCDVQYRFRNQPGAQVVMHWTYWWFRSCMFPWLCWFSGDAMIFCNNFTPLERIFRRLNKRLGGSFLGTFEALCTRFGPRTIEKLIEKTSILLFGVRKSSFGEHKLGKMITKDMQRTNIFWNHLANLLQR